MSDRKNAQHIDELLVDRLVELDGSRDGHIYDLVILHADHDVSLPLLKSFNGRHTETACKNPVLRGGGSASLEMSEN